MGYFEKLEGFYRRYEAREVIFIDNTMHFCVFDREGQRMIQDCATIQEARWLASKLNSQIAEDELNDGD